MQSQGSSDAEVCEISSEESDEQCPKVGNRDREERQRRKYDLLFGGAHVPIVAWERLPDGDVACHVSKLVFATAVQCLNHQQKHVYNTDLAASKLMVDVHLLQALKKQAEVEKADLHAHKHAMVRHRNQMKQDLRMEIARLAKANRQLEHDLEIIKSKIKRVQTQHNRQMEHLTTTSLRKIDKLARHLERRAKTRRQIEADEGTSKDDAQRCDGAQDLTVSPNPMAAAPTTIAS